MKLSIIKKLFGLITIGFSIVFTTHVFANTVVTTYAAFDYIPNCCFSNIIQKDTDAQSANVEVVQDYTTTDPNFVAVGQANASGYADYGVLKVKAFAEGGNGFAASSVGTATAKFNDTLLISSSSLNGTSGTAIIDLKLNYGGGVSGPYGDAVYQFTMQNYVYLNGNANSNPSSFVLNSGVNCVNSLSCNITNEAYLATSLGTQDVPILTNQNDLYTIAIPFVYGAPLSINLTATASAIARGAIYTTDNDVTSAIMDSSHSFYWGGIAQILDQNSNIISDFSVTSDSGTNYLQDFSVSPSAVPIPKSYTLLLTGLGLLGLAKYRRKNPG